MTQVACTKSRTSLEGLELFSALPEDERWNLADQCSWRRLGPNQLLIDGDTGSPHGVFVLTEGIVEVSQRDSKSRMVPVGWLSAPACFGEFAAIMSCPGATSVRTKTSCEVAELSEETFTRLLSKYPTLSLKVLKKAISIVRALDDDIARLHFADNLLVDAHRKAMMRSL
jgi:CRP/FNR family transcriptional regulator, cyclic AMP receptor protein